MSFTSIPFLLFALLFFGFWPLAKRWKSLRLLYLASFSLLFYGWWDWRYVGLLLYTAVMDFTLALCIERFPTRKRVFLILSLGSNLAVLAYFKYANFFLDQIAHVAAVAGFGFDPALRILLPVGISFYTFQSMSYTLDVYKGKLKPTHNPLEFLAFVSLFPQLVSGPIVRAYDLLPQIARPVSIDARMVWVGLAEIVLGFFKKLVIADNLGPVVATLWAQPPAHAGLPYWLAAGALFGLQIYCDFSGYSSIAIGLARCMGYQFGTNFNRPYAASSFADFWMRWHISLSSWFRDYVYIPLGGNRDGRAAGLRNLWITMLLSGLWHGANYTFLVWAALHAAFMSIERLLGWLRVDLSMRPLAWIWRGVVLLGVCYAWLWFRAPDAHAALLASDGMLRSLGGAHAVAALFGFKEMFALLAYLFVDFSRFSPTRALAERHDLQIGLRNVLVLWAMAVLTVFMRGAGDAFIYFQF